MYVNLHLPMQIYELQRTSLFAIRYFSCVTTFLQYLQIHLLHFPN